jgi:hypothetical protein
MVGGNKNTEATALDYRVNEDSDPTSATYAAYIAGGMGNGRRVIGVPVNSGPVVVAPWTDTFTAVGISAFFLLPDYSGVTGSTSICAEYIGPYVEGLTGSGAGSQSGSSSGGYIVRLVY